MEESPKIPGNCKDCGRPLDRGDMERYLHFCEKVGVVDPVQEALNQTPPGIRCFHCLCGRIVEGAEDGERDAKKVMADMRARHLGLRVVKGGK